MRSPKTSLLILLFALFNLPLFFLIALTSNLWRMIKGAKNYNVFWGTEPIINSHHWARATQQIFTRSEFISRYDSRILNGRASSVLFSSEQIANPILRLVRSFSENIEFLSHLPRDNWVILEAHMQEERVASLLLIFTSDFVEYFTPVTLAEYKQLQPLSLLILHGFLFATEKKIRYWNWGGTWMNQEGVYKFKKQRNPKESAYFYHTKILKQSILDMDVQTLMSAYPHFYVYPINQNQ